MIKKRDLKPGDRKYEVVLRLASLLVQLKKCKIFTKNLKFILWALFIEGEDWHELQFCQHHPKFQLTICMDENDKFFLYVSYHPTEINERITKEIEMNFSDFRRYF